MKVKITLIVVLTLIGAIASENMYFSYFDVYENVKNYADALMDINPNSFVYLPFYGEKASQFDLDLIYKVTWRLIFQKDVRLIIHLMDDSAAFVLEEQLNSLNIHELYNKSEGVDYVILPYPCMDEVSLQEFYGDIKGVIPIDNRNNDLHFIPMMENIISFHDVDGT